MSHKWAEKKTLLFVRLYRHEECLWDVTHHLYRNNYTRDQAYKNIIRGMGERSLSVADVKSKIKNLRSTYYQELKKIADSKKGGAQVYSPTVLWFKELDPIMQDVAQTKAYLQDPLAIVTTIKEEPPLIADYMEADGSPTEGQTEHTGDETPSNSSSKHEHGQHWQGGSLEKECEMFGKYVAACLMRLPTESRFAAENSIFQMLMKEKCDVYKETIGKSSSTFENSLNDQ